MQGSRRQRGYDGERHFRAAECCRAVRESHTAYHIDVSLSSPSGLRDKPRRGELLADLNSLLFEEQGFMSSDCFIPTRGSLADCYSENRESG